MASEEEHRRNAIRILQKVAERSVCLARCLRVIPHLKQKNLPEHLGRLGAFPHHTPLTLSIF
jgi:hypothetical protein